MSKLSETLRSIGGRAFLDPIALAIAAPFMLASSLLVSANSDEIASIIAWLFANFVAFGVCVSIVLVLNKTWFKNKTQQPIIFPVVLATGAALGAIKGLATSFTVWCLGLEPLFLSHVLPKMIQTAVLGMWVVPIFALLGEARFRFQAVRDLLVAERVRQGLAEGEGRNTSEAKSRANLQNFIELAKEKILSGASLESAKLIRDIVEHSVRPISHKLWKLEDAKQRDFSFGTLAKVAVMNQPFQFVPVTLVYAITALPAIAPVIGFKEGLLAVGVSAIVVAVVFILARMVQFKTFAASLTYFFAVILITTVAEIQVPSLMFGQTELSTQFKWYLVTFIWLGELTFLSGFITGAIANHNLTRSQLESAIGASGVSEAVEKAKNNLTNRELANLLHGNVQNSLLAVALRIESKQGDTSEVIAELEAVERLLQSEQHIAADDAKVKSCTERLEEFKKQWAGFVHIDYSLSGIDNLSPLLRSQMSQLVGESISNAVRHGIARNILIGIVFAPNRVSVAVSDDGLGPRNGKKGLGSTFLDLIAKDNWSLTPNPAGGSTLRVQLATLAHT